MADDDGSEGDESRGTKKPHFFLIHVTAKEKYRDCLLRKERERPI
jgi:hypothetical protein